jgi:hypothetical protein
MDYRNAIKKYITDFQNSPDKSDSFHEILKSRIAWATEEEKNNISRIAKGIIAENYEGIIQAIMGEYVSPEHMDIAIKRVNKKKSDDSESASSQSSDSSQSSAYSDSTASSGFSDFAERTPSYMRDLFNYQKLGGKKTKRRYKSKAKKSKAKKSKRTKRTSKKKTKKSKTYKK